MTNLISLAKASSLPQIQHMDTYTIKWIEKSGGNLKSSSLQTPKKLKDDVQKYKPSRKWFVNPACYDSIHGARHMARVVTNASNLTLNRATKPVLMRNLLIASSIHDVRRLDDKGDSGHAKRAASWFLANTDLISESFSVALTRKDAAEISAALYFHEIPYSEIKDSRRYLQHKDIVDLLKTADALDRYRLPKLKWWINNNFLIVHPTIREKKFAFNLVVNSEKKYLLTNKSTFSVLSTLS